MKKVSFIGLLFFSILGFSQQKTIDQKVEALLKQMTLEEKIGQLNQYTGNNQATGPITINPNKEAEIKGKKIPAYKTFEGVPIYTNHKNDD